MKACNQIVWNTRFSWINQELTLSDHQRLGRHTHTGAVVRHDLNGVRLATLQVTQAARGWGRVTVNLLSGAHWYHASGVTCSILCPVPSHGKHTRGTLNLSTDVYWTTRNCEKTVRLLSSIRKRIKVHINTLLCSRYLSIWLPYQILAVLDLKAYWYRLRYGA